MPPKDKLLFTPGPLTTSRTVKEAMLRDLGSRDPEFIEIVRRVRETLLAIGGVSQQAGFEAVLMQGSGTFGVESVISSVLPPEGRLLVVANGAYGERMARMARILRVSTEVLRCNENRVADPADVDAVLRADPSISHVAMVHCETTTGILNPVEEVGAVCREEGRSYLLDSMSAFGGVPLDLEACGVDFVISSANKCIEGVPGFAFVLCRREALLATHGWCRSLSLDLVEQWRGLEKDGMFRFTPPTHVILAFDRALRELHEEGGVAGRTRRYRANQRCLVDGMAALGFRTYLPEEIQSPIITSFRYPDHPDFRFEEFYTRVAEKGFVIYPGKVSDAACFRIGTAGRIFEKDVTALVGAIGVVLQEMGIALGGSS